MLNQLPIALFLFTDKNCTRLPTLPKEAERLKDIFEHHENSFKYEAAHNFSKATFTQTFVANGKDTAISHLAKHGTAEGFVIDGDPQN